MFKPKKANSWMAEEDICKQLLDSSGRGESEKNFVTSNSWLNRLKENLKQMKPTTSRGFTRDTRKQESQLSAENTIKMCITCANKFMDDQTILHDDFYI